VCVRAPLFLFLDDTSVIVIMISPNRYDHCVQNDSGNHQNGDPKLSDGLVYSQLVRKANLTLVLTLTYPKPQLVLMR